MDKRNKILIAGDSFGVYDNKFGHWVQILADEYGYETDFIACPGSGYVENINHFWANEDISNNISEYKYLFYHATDATRISILKNNSNKAAINRLTNFYESSDKDWEWFLYGEKRLSPRKSKYVDLLSNTEEKLYTKNHNHIRVTPDEPSVYNYLSIKAITSANMNSLRGLLWYTHLHGVKNFIIRQRMWAKHVLDIEKHMPVDYIHETFGLNVKEQPYAYRKYYGSEQMYIDNEESKNHFGTPTHEIFAANWIKKQGPL